MTVKKNRSTPRGREFWFAVKNAASTVHMWPDWKRGHSHRRLTSSQSQEPKLSPGAAFRLQPDGSWSVEKLPHPVIDEAEFSGYLTIQGYRCSVFEMPDKSMWAQKSVNTPATASSKEHSEPDMSVKCPECGGEATDVRAYSACCSNGHFFSVKPPVSSLAFDKESGSMDTIASRVAHAWLSRTADRADNLVSQVSEILNGESDSPFGHDDVKYDEDITEWCKEARKFVPKMQEIFDTAFHSAVDIKAEVPESDNPKVRQLAQEKLSEMISQAAARIEIISHGLLKEIETLCVGLEVGSQRTKKEASIMKPSELSSALRRIASKIENSKKPDRTLVAQDLKKVLASIDEIPEIPETSET